MRKNLIAVAALGFLMAGCASSETVYLKNPQTGDTVQCGPYTSYGRLSAQEQANIEKLRYCISDFQRQGYERVGSPR